MQLKSPTTVSALMATYRGENPLHLAAALQSLVDQTERPHEIILVIDGPIDDAQQDVINEFAAKAARPIFSIIALPENGGLARAQSWSQSLSGRLYHAHG